MVLLRSLANWQRSARHDATRIPQDYCYVEFVAQYGQWAVMRNRCYLCFFDVTCSRLGVTGRFMQCYLWLLAKLGQQPQVTVHFPRWNKKAAHSQGVMCVPDEASYPPASLDCCRRLFRFPSSCCQLARSRQGWVSPCSCAEAKPGNSRRES